MPSRVARLAPFVLLVWVLVGALVPRLSPLRPIYLVNTYALVPVLLGAVLLEKFVRRGAGGGVRPTPSDVALAAFLLFALVSIGLQRPTPESLNRSLIDLWRTFVVPFAVFWVVRAARPREREMAAWAAPLAVLCLLEVAVGLLAWFHPEALPASLPGSVKEIGGSRITGTLPQADLYAGLLVFCAAFALDVTDPARPRAARWLAGGCLTLAFTGVFLTFSRASWLGGLAAFAILAAAHGRRVAAPAVAVALAVVFLARAPAGGGRRTPTAPASGVTSRPGAESYAASRLTTGKSITDRIVLDAAGVKMFLQKPLLGWGFGTYDRHARDFVGPVGPFVPTDWARNEAASHCTHLSLLAELGVIGYALVAFPVATIAARILRRRARWRNPGIPAALAIVAFLAVASVLVDLRYVAFSLGIGAVALGLIAARLDEDEPGR